MIKCQVEASTWMWKVAVDQMMAGVISMVSGLELFWYATLLQNGQAIKTYQLSLKWHVLRLLILVK